MTALTTGDANCPWGGSRFSAGATVAYACNGAPGTPGGSGGASDGGASNEPLVVVGLTPQQYTGNLGGRPGAHALCSATYANSHFCSVLEYINGPNPITIPLGGAWVDGSLPPTTSRLERIESATCGMWTSGVINNGTEGSLILPSGSSTTSYLGLSNSGCQTPRPLLCCRGPSLAVVRGLTPTAFTGNLGGRPGGNALCAAAFPNSHFCSTLEYINSPSPVSAPAGGAWVDGSLPSTGSKLNRWEIATCGMWTSGVMNNGSEGALILPSGSSSTSYLGLSNSGCQTPRPLFCCE